MATIAIMVGGAVLNAATFIGGNYLAKALSGDSGKAALDEKMRHDKALEAYQYQYQRMYCIETPGNETASLKMSTPRLV